MHVLTQSQAGLFSAVTSAFILDVQSQLQSDTGEETVALLRVLISKIDNTTFGNDPPALPQWSGPPHAIVQVQAILYASLAASLISAFLAMLGKQWLNRYASTDMRGTAIERSQNRQRKLDGIVTWYFDYVMESLPLMLQVALLLLGCALARYLWGVNITVASVVIAVTSFGIILYIFIITAGAASETCPYQTPGSRAIRFIGRKAWSTLDSATSTVASTLGDASRESATIATIKANLWDHRPWWSRGNVGPFLRDMALGIPQALIIDISRLGRVVIRLLAAFSFTILWSLVGFVDRMRSWLHSTPSNPEQGLDQQLSVLDLRCISWMLQISLDKAIRLSTLKHLAMMTTFTNFNPTLVEDCFNIFIGCINVGDCKVAVIQGLEQLATVSATCFLRTFCYLLAVDPASSVLADIRQRYQWDFPLGADFMGLPFHYTLVWIDALVNQRRNPQHLQWGNYRPSAQEHTAVAQDMVEAAQAEYQNTQQQKVPCWILHFTLHSLSLSPPPPMPVIANCLSIIAIDLGCDVMDTRFTTPDERYVHILQMTIALNPSQCTSEEGLKPNSREA